MRCVSCKEPTPAGAATCPSCGAPRRASAADLEAAFNEGPPPTAGPPRIGKDFGTRYVVQKLLGMGGMGVVYQALDRDLGVEVALKVLRPAGATPRAVADMKRRFKSELLLARQITHKNVIRIHDIGQINGFSFLSMPLVEGPDLATRLKSGPMDPEKTLRYARQLVAGLMAVHGAGVIHRDLKPANIMIGSQDQAILMDFGIARATVPSGPQRTMPGAMVGTAAYMAPEQARGEAVDARCDIYSFGLVMYEMLVGERQITAADVFARMKAAPTPARQINPHVPEALDVIVTRCLQPEPAKRYQSAVELATALAALSRRGDGRAAGALLGNRWATRAAAALLVLALGGLGYWMVTRGALTALATGLSGTPADAGAEPERNDELADDTDPTSHARASSGDGSQSPRDGGGLLLASLPLAYTGNGPMPGFSSSLSAAPGDDEGASPRWVESALSSRDEGATATIDPAAYDAAHDTATPLAAAAALADPATARVRYAQLAASGPRGASQAASGLADLALYEGHHAAAAELLLPAIADDIRSGNRSGLATKYIFLAEARAGQGRPADAATLVRMALDSSREEDILLQAARLLVSLRLEDEARALVKELDADAGGEGHGHTYARIVDAELALGRGDTDAAILTLRRALEAGDLWLVRLVLGTAYLQAQQYSEAMAELDICELRREEGATMMAETTPTVRSLPVLQYLLARARAGVGRTRQAAESFRQFLIMRPGSPDGMQERDARQRLTQLVE